MFQRRRLAVLAVLVGVACSDSTGPEPGTTVTLGNGTLRTFYQAGAGGAPVALGATFDAGLLTGLPTLDTFMTVQLPAQASGGGTVFTHLYFDYVPHGHEPAMVFDTAHFDFHFYFIPAALRELIAAGVDTFTVPPQFVPANYKKVSETVARMGTHWADSTGPEFTGGVGAWNRSMIYGYHEGQFQFYDAMITKQWLETQPTDTVTFAQPASFPVPGYYPTKFTVGFDANAQRYRVALEGFVQR